MEFLVLGDVLVGFVNFCEQTDVYVDFWQI